MATKNMSTLQFPDSADVYEITDKKAREEKIDKNQGVSNAGKLMAVGENGKVSLVNPPTIDSTLSTSSTNAIQNQAVARKMSELSTKINEHNTSSIAHDDIRTLITELTNRLNTLADSDDTTLDQLSEIVTYIKYNKSLIDSITTSKVSVSDIINNLTTNVTNKPLSAAQGIALKALIDAITVPTKVSELTNDSGYLTSYTETDPTVPAWAKASRKPTYTASEVGAYSKTEINNRILGVQSGSYTGTGAYGSSSQNSLTFNFAPKIVIINEATNYNFFAIMIYGSSDSSVFPGTDAGDVMGITLAWSNKSVSWYGQSAAQWQLNRSGKVYNWVAIG